MSRFDGDRLDDINAAIDAIRSHLRRGGLEDDLVLDAVPEHRYFATQVEVIRSTVDDDLSNSEPRSSG